MTDVVETNGSGQRPTRIQEQEAEELFGFAVSHDPSELFDTLNRPKTHELAGAARSFLSLTHSEGMRQASYAQELLLNRIGDTAHFITETLALHPTLTVDQAIAIARHKRTLTAFSIIAGQGQGLSATMLDYPGKVYKLSHDKESIMVCESLPLTLDGTYRDVDLNTDTTLESWPLFDDFAPWAGVLAVHSFYEHPWKQ